MTTFTFNIKNIVFVISCTCISISAMAQVGVVNRETDSTFIKQIPADTSGNKLNMDAVYNRPFIYAGKLPIAIGGYLEANTQYAGTNGTSDGFSFQFRRMSLFLSSTIGKRIKFLTEIEFDGATKAFNINYAAMDMEFHPLLNLRGGIILNPIGLFNQNHDGPKWDFIDRPISSTTIIPSVLSNAGFGLYGKHFCNNWIFGYEAYLTNGFDDNIIANEENRTSLAAGNLNPAKFDVSNSGLPTFTGKIAIRNRKIGELGLSFLSGVYNNWKEDGIVLDEKRSASIVAVDFSTSQLKNRLNITTEVAKVFVNVPETYSQTFGSEQFGGFIDIAGTIIQHKMLGWENSKINLVLRLEYVDYNEGEFKETGDNIQDDVWAIVPGITFRPVASTVLRFNYRHQQQQDLLGNPPSKTGVIQFGFASYF